MDIIYRNRGENAKKSLHTIAQTWISDEKGAKEDAIKLHEALCTEVINSNTIIEVLARNCNRQRLEISKQYFNIHGKHLRDVFRRKLSRGWFKQLVLVLMMPIAEFYAKELRSALSGLICKKDTLILLLCIIDQDTLCNVNQCYWKLYNFSLEFDIKRNTTGYFQRLLVQLSLNRRSRDLKVNVNQAKIDAKDLMAAGEERLGTDEATFNRILTTRSMPQLLKIFEEYGKLAKHPIETGIYREFSGILQSGLISLVTVVRNKSSFVASKLYESMVGLGTKNKRLIRLIVTQVETDFTPVKYAFEERYGITLSKYIEGDTSGDFCTLLQALIGENVNENAISILPV